MLGYIRDLCTSLLISEVVAQRQSVTGSGSTPTQHRASLGKTSGEPGKTLPQATSIACQLKNPPDWILSENSSCTLLSNTCLFTCSKEQKDDTQLIGQLANSSPDNLKGGIILPIRKRRGGTGQAGLRRRTNSQCGLPSMLSVANVTLMCSGLQVHVSCPI